MVPPALPAPPEGLPRPGDVVLGKYRVEQILGTGGMGLVVAATHLTLKERVALKFLHPELSTREDLVTRFIREAQAAVRIKSEHVARVMDVAQLPSGAPFLVMEFLQGTDFSRQLRLRGPLPPDEVVDAILQVCSALSEAHSLGIVHRDLKPGNIFLTKRLDGAALVKVLDFGISKVGPTEHRGVPGEEEPTLTTGEDVLGSPLYMSPEQIKTPRDVDGRADIWSLGAIFYRLLTGKSAFQADNPAAILARIVSEAPIPLRQVRPEVSPELEAVVHKCLERDMNERFQTVQELAIALLPIAPATTAASVWSAQTSTSFPRIQVPEELRRSTSVPAGESTQGAWAMGGAPRARKQLYAGVAFAGAVALGAVLFLVSRPPARVESLGRLGERLPDVPKLMRAPAERPALVPSASAPAELPASSATAAAPTVKAAPRPVRRTSDPLDGRL